MEQNVVNINRTNHNKNSKKFNKKIILQTTLQIIETILKEPKINSERLNKGT